MAIHRVELPPSELQLCKSRFPGSGFQKFIHNRLFDEVEKARTTLENAADFAAFQKAQNRILALREVIGILHEDDTDTTKKFYGL